MDEKTKEITYISGEEREMRKNKVLYLFILFLFLFVFYLSIESFRVSTNGNKHHVDNR